MQFNFRQGIIRMPVGSLTYSTNYVNVIVSTLPIELSLAYKNSNYYHTENTNVLQAWNVSAVPASETAYLYIDLDIITGERTFGYTMYDMVYGPTAPTNPSNDQHWFDTTNNLFKRYISLTRKWITVVRVFVGTYVGGSSTVTYPYKNPLVSHINVTGSNPAGRILYDGTGTAIRTSTGEFLTTESDFQTYGGLANTVRMESDLTLVKANENIPAFSVVKIDGYGTSNYPVISLADYNDVNDTVIAICPVALSTGEVASIVTRGLITNTDWDWQSVVDAGARLFVGIGAEAGTLVYEDPFVTQPLLATERKPAVAKVLSTTSVLFQQSFEAAGLTGEQGPPGPGADPATTLTLGTVRLSAVPTTPTSPIVISDTDPRLTDARTPLSHTQAATTVTSTSNGNVQDDLDYLRDNKLDLSGGTLTGDLILNADPTDPLGAATKQFVEDSITNASSLFVTLADNNIIEGDNTFNGDNTFTSLVFVTETVTYDNQAVPKSYVDNVAQDVIDYVENAILDAEWQVKTIADSPFNIEVGVNYIIDTSGGDVEGIMPETLESNFILRVKDAAKPGYGFSPTTRFLLTPHPSATYTIMNDAYPIQFEVDQPSPELTFAYDSVNNNVVI